MITYHALGFYGLLGTLGAVVLMYLLPNGSRAHRLLFRAVLAALLLVAALVGLSY
jgi:hypothetical protein